MSALQDLAESAERADVAGIEDAFDDRSNDTTDERQGAGTRIFDHPDPCPVRPESLELEGDIGLAERTQSGQQPEPTLSIVLADRGGTRDTDRPDTDPVGERRADGRPIVRNRDLLRTDQPVRVAIGVDNA
jgi:hypothetical protein